LRGVATALRGYNREKAHEEKGTEEKGKLLCAVPVKVTPNSEDTTLISVSKQQLAQRMAEMTTWTSWV
jgi:hypothetical protein